MSFSLRLRRVLLSFFLLIFLGFLLVFFFETLGFGIPCLLHFFTGLYCPGCGMFRAFVSLLHLQIYQAFRYNALLFLVAPFLLAALVQTLVSYLKGSTLCTRKWEAPLAIALAVLAILFGVLRNVPAFAFLAPTTL